MPIDRKLLLILTYLLPLSKYDIYVFEEVQEDLNLQPFLKIYITKKRQK